MMGGAYGVIELDGGVLHCGEDVDKLGNVSRYYVDRIFVEHTGSRSVQLALVSTSDMVMC